MTQCLGQRHYHDDEVPDVERVTDIGWELTDEEHGFCSWCGIRGHIHDVCPNRPEAA